MAETDVLQSPSDHRAYKWLQLPNGLKTLLIHDPQIGATSSDGLIDDRPRHPGEDEVVTDDDDVDSLISDDDSGSSGSHGSGSGSDDEDDCDAASKGSGGGRKGAHGGAVKKAAAAMSVGVGHFSDPWRLQGLSHYLEHMLFMGSQKYPDENDYDAYLSAQGGSSNACTEEEATTFHFDCRPDALRPALDRFAQFFVAPLLKADALEREVQAVDNEFSGVAQSDGCRLMQLRAHTARPGHVASKFGWGNRKSLVEDPAAAGTDVRAELLQHYNQQYSAERMNLVVLGGEPLDTLQEWATELFSGIAGGRGPRLSFAAEGAPFEGGQLYVMAAVREEHRLSALFQLPCLAAEYRKKAEDYLSHLIGHEGKGSLLAALKLRGWATDLSAGLADQNSAAWLFDISITLTESGLAAGAGCGLAAAGLLFEYLSMLRAAGPQRWAWDEMAAIAAMKFQFQEEEDAAEYVAQLATDMHTYPPHHTVAGPFLHEEFDAELISQLLGSMKPAAVRLDLVTYDYEACKAATTAFGSIAVGEEPWFGIPYVQVPIPAELLRQWETAAPSDDIVLPPKNSYLPSDFSLKCDEAGAADAEMGNGTGAAADMAIANGSARPEAADGIDASEETAFPSPPVIVLEEPGLRVWHKLDRSFRLPRANAYFRVACPVAYASPRAAAATHLTMKLLEDALCEEAYLADVAGLHYGLWFEGKQGIDVKVDGFNHKLPLLVGLIFRSLAALQFVDEDFARVKEALVRTYRNSKMKPLKHSSFLRLRALRQSLWDVEAVRAELEALSPADVRTFLPTLLGDTHLEALLFGSVTAEEARAVAGAARAALGARGAGIAGDCTLCIPDGSSLVLREAAYNAEEDNSVAEVYLQCGPAAAPTSRAVLDLTDQLMYEPCYDTLRTKEQLGYTVHSGARLTHGVQGMCILVQSAVHGPAHLDARIDAFLAAFGERLGRLEDADFEQNRTALLAAKLMKDRNMLEESDRAWDAIVSRGRDFHARREEVAVLRRVTLDQVREFFSATLVPGAPARRKLAVHVVAKAHADELGTDKAESGAEVVGDVDGLKERLGFYPPVTAAASE